MQVEQGGISLDEEPPPSAHKVLLQGGKVSWHKGNRRGVTIRAAMGQVTSVKQGCGGLSTMIYTRQLWDSNISAGTDITSGIAHHYAPMGCAQVFWEGTAHAHAMMGRSLCSGVDTLQRCRPKRDARTMGAPQAAWVRKGKERKGWQGQVDRGGRYADLMVSWLTRQGPIQCPRTEVAPSSHWCSAVLQIQKCSSRVKYSTGGGRRHESGCVGGRHLALPTSSAVHTMGCMHASLKVKAPSRVP